MTDNGVATGLVYYAKLNEGAGTAIADWSGNGLSSVVTNGTWAYESMPGTGCLTSADLSKQLCYFTSSTSLNTISYFTGEVLSTNDYYAFGANMPGRNFSSNSYRYGFNGKENDPETGTQDYGMRIYNPSLGKFLRVDPLSAKYPFYTPYQFASNRPVDGIDLDGLEYATFTIFIQNGLLTKITTSTDYELKDKLTLGPGIKYNYAYLDKNGKIEKFEALPMLVNIYGIYQGPDNPKLPEVGGKPGDTHWDYSLATIDKQDAYALAHDLIYDKLK